MKKIILIIKRVCVAIFLLYGMNVILSSLNIVIPINVFTIGIVSLLNIPGFLALVLMYYII